MEYISSDDESNISQAPEIEQIEEKPATALKNKYTPKLNELGQKLTKRGTVDKRVLKNAMGAEKMKLAREKLAQIKLEARKTAVESIESDEELEEDDDPIIIAPKSEIKRGMKEVKANTKSKESRRYHQLREGLAVLTLQMGQLKEKNASLEKQANKPRVKIVNKQPNDPQQANPIAPQEPILNLEKIKNIIKL